MQRKVLDIQMDGFHLTCLRIGGSKNPYRVYRVYAGHRRQIAKYGDIISVLCFIKDLYLEGADVLPIWGLEEWAKKYGKGVG